MQRLRARCIPRTQPLAGEFSRSTSIDNSTRLQIDLGDARTAGESCTDPAQCEGTLTCSDNDTCRPVELVGEGKSCGSADFLQACRPSLSCEPSPRQSDAICASLAGLDESCAPSDSAGCKPGLFCTQNEVCKELRPMGADCLANRQCASEHCRDGTCAEVHFCPNAS